MHNSEDVAPTPKGGATQRLHVWVFAIASVYFVAAWLGGRVPGLESPFIWCPLALILMLVALPGWSVLLEVSLVPGAWLLAWVLHLRLGLYPAMFLITATTLLWLARLIEAPLPRLVAVAVSLLWLAPVALRPAEVSWIGWALVGCGGLTLLFELLSGTGQLPPLRRIDLIVSSYSGNTAKYAEYFAQGARSAGAEVTVHRHHYYKSFAPELNGDALAIAFPCIAFTVPWSLMEYVLFKLPRGRGKPVFLLYTAGGGPENTHVLPWLVLRLKGYRIQGRLWAMYPLNVPIFRLAVSIIWRWIDSLLPRPSDDRLLSQSGERFARGLPAGLGFVMLPFPLFLTGILFYNRYINYVYRSYSFKRLCNQCGRCVRYCPTERLIFKNGRVRSKGTCIYCYGCVNLCPTEAMQILLLSEWGNPYRPRWPKLLVRRKPQVELPRKSGQCV